MKYICRISRTYVNKFQCPVIGLFICDYGIQGYVLLGMSDILSVQFNSLHAVFCHLLILFFQKIISGIPSISVQSWHLSGLIWVQTVKMQRISADDTQHYQHSVVYKEIFGQILSTKISTKIK